MTKTKSNSSSSLSALQVQVYGEQTSVPIDIPQATFCSSTTSSGEPLPFLDMSLVTVELSLLNQTVSHDVSAKIRLQLPSSSNVKRFEVFRDEDNKWYPATAVPNKTAKEVVYKEKEKGRAVAAVSNVASGTSLFEIDISPLKYQHATRCRLDILVTASGSHCGDSCAEELAASMFPDYKSEKSSTKVIFHNLPYVDPSKLTSKKNKAGAIVGEAFGKTHFVCKIPSLRANHDSDAMAVKWATLKRVVVLCDSSASMVKNANNFSTSIGSKLRELFETAKTETVDLYTFGIRSPTLLGTFQDFNGLFNAITNDVEYDGGTRLSMLPPFLAELSKRDDSQVDCALVISDGVDCLGHSIEFTDSSVTFPVHCIAPDCNGGTVNMSNLSALASASYTSPGTVLTTKSDNFLQGVVFPRPVLQSIWTNQDEYAFLEEEDDGFCCVPDHRLRVINRPIGNDGMLITGILKQDRRQASSVTKLSARFILGSENVHEFHFDFTKHSHGKHYSPRNVVDEAKAAVHHDCPTMILKADCDETGSSRILGHVFAEELYNQVKMVGWKSGTSTFKMKTILEELAMTYGFCSPESTLLMLYDSQQFLDNGIEPPMGHPARQDSGLLDKLRQGKNDGNKLVGVGEIGGPKNIQQQGKVVDLARRFDDFFSQEDKPKEQERFSPQAGSCFSVSFSGRLPERVGGASPGAGSCFSGRLPERAGGGGRAPPRCAVRAMDYECEEGAELDIGAPPQCEECAFMGEGWDFCRTGRQSYSLLPAQGRMSVRSNPVEAAQNLDQYIDDLASTLDTRSNDKSNWKELYRKNMTLMGGNESASPSFFLSTARVLAIHELSGDAIVVATNCLETGIDNVQMLRSVGYLLLSIKTMESIDMSIQVFDKVRELEPCEPQSFLDSGLSRLLRAWETYREQASLGDGNVKCPGDIIISSSNRSIQSDMIAAQDFIAHVLTHHWARRFQEVEWPALVLLHHIADLVQEMNKHMEEKLPEWPLGFDEAFKTVSVPEKVEKNVQPNLLRCSKFEPSLTVYLGWDTDKTDIDLHVKEPSGKLVYYANKRGVGSLLSNDFTQGYGPEVYMAKNGIADNGDYEVYAKYFASHQDSALTGTTSAVVWTIETDRAHESTRIKFGFLRLQTKKEKTHVATARVT